MGILDWLRRGAVRPAAETRSGFTAAVIAEREAFISGRRGIGELTATVQSCVSLWEAGLAAADAPHPADDGDGGARPRPARRSGVPDPRGRPCALRRLGRDDPLGPPAGLACERAGVGWRA